MLVSRIMIKRSIRPEYRYTVLFLPIIGVLIIPILGLTGALSRMIFVEPFLIAVSVLCVQYGLFNIFHFDGLLDSADALIVFAGREKRLDILKDVKIGSFAFFVGAMYLAVKLYLLSRGAAMVFLAEGGLPARIALSMMLLSFGISGRAAAAMLPCVLRPARPGGLGALLTGSKIQYAIFGTIISIIPSLLCWIALPGGADEHGWFLLLVFLSIPGASLLTGLWYARKIGGYTGDALGLAVELGELVHLLIFFIIIKGAF